jgi:hypothetical protein
MMSDIKIPKEAISRQIADSVDLIVQVKRLRDGSRRTTNITEVIGMEGRSDRHPGAVQGSNISTRRRTARSSANIARWVFALYAREGQAVRLRPAVSGGVPVSYFSIR